MTPSEDDGFSEESTDRRLKDHNDLHVLDFGRFIFPSLFLPVGKLYLNISPNTEHARAVSPCDWYEDSLTWPAWTHQGY